jgi:DNA-binding CsgD family transcriptional regulator/tetratricopeptide (TPR) repeat protein
MSSDPASAKTTTTLSTKQLLGRRGEREAISQLLQAARGGTGGVLVIHGEPGVGKTALLDDTAQAATGFRTVSAVGVEGEMELPFAALQQLCSPILSFAERLPDIQRAALSVAFGLSAGPPPDAFLIGLATLGLLSEGAAAQPLLCIVDDAQWLDSASAKALTFAARRVLAEKIAVFFAARELDAGLAALPTQQLQPLGQTDARDLMRSVMPGPIDERVLERLVVETHGNPLAVVEFPRGLAPAQLAGGFALPAALALTTRIEDSFARRLDGLSTQARRLLLLASAEPTGDPALLWRAARALEIPESAGQALEAEGLLALSDGVAFRHPLFRSAVYGTADPEELRQTHRVLAEAIDPQLDPDRRAWHRAQAAVAPDEDVAAELERSAARARSRGGVAAAAAFLERAVTLSPEPGRRAERALAAAQAYLQAGEYEAALRQLASAEPALLDEMGRAHVELMRGQIEFASSAGSEAPGLLLEAAKRIEPLDIALARETYLDAWVAAFFAGGLARVGTLHEISRAARSAPQPASAPRPADLLLDALSVLVTEGRAAAAPLLRQVVPVLTEGEIAMSEGLRWGWLATHAGWALWDDQSWHQAVPRQLRTVRDAGLLENLPVYLQTVGANAAWRGDFALAASLIAEADTITEATGAGLARYAAVVLECFRGREREARALLAVEMSKASAAGQGYGIQICQWLSAMLSIALGRYAEALADAQQASEEAPELWTSGWALAEVIEAATRTGKTLVAREALERLAESASVGDSDWGFGVLARSRGLLSEGEEAESCYREAIERLGRVALRPELARAHLVYGEWLRRKRRRADARAQLRAAHEQFTSIGMEAFAERARVELQATGERARKRTVDTIDQLTPQEAQIAGLAADGHTNREIAAQMFISPSTVEYHLGKVFRKLDVKSRTELAHKLHQREGDVGAGFDPPPGLGGS